VSLDVERGLQVVNVLERAKLNINVALWVYLSEYEDWRLVISGRQFDTLDPRSAYRELYKALDMAGFPTDKIPPLMTLPMSDAFIKALRKLFGKSKTVEGMRLGGQMIGDRFIEDAYVYRIS
jgi:hypothetical protein